MRPSHLAFLPWIILISVLLAIFFFADGYVMTLAMVMMLWAILGSALNFVFGYTGFLHLGLGAFYAVGAYGAAVLSMRFQFPIIVALVVMPVLAAAIGALIGPLILRTKGLHFAVATLALGMIVSDLLNNWVSLTGGPIGIAGIPRAGAITILGSKIDFGTLPGMFAIMAIVLVGILALCAILRGGRFVLVLRSIKSDDVFTASLGFSTMPYKVGAFALAGAIAAEAGVLYAHLVQYISPEPFTFFAASFEAFVVLAVGGPGTLWGAVLGSILISGLPEVLQINPQVRLLAYGAVLLLVTVLFKRGLSGALESAALRLFRKKSQVSIP